MFSYIQHADKMDAVRRIGMFLVSTVVHFLALLIFIVLPLIFIGAIPDVQLLSFLIAAPTPPPPQTPPTPPINQPKTVAPQRIKVETFVSPAAMPVGIAPPDIEPMPDGLISANLAGVSGSLTSGNPNAISGSPMGRLVFENALPPPSPPPPQPPQRKAPVRRGGDVQESKLIRKVDPIYPPLAIRSRVSGVVILDVRVDEEGNVDSIRVLKGHPLLDESAIKAVAQWKYSPTILNGEPVSIVATVTVIFNLR